MDFFYSLSDLFRLNDFLPNDWAIHGEVVLLNLVTSRREVFLQALEWRVQFKLSKKNKIVVQSTKHFAEDRGNQRICEIFLLWDSEMHMFFSIPI